MVSARPGVDAGAPCCVVVCRPTTTTGVAAPTAAAPIARPTGHRERILAALAEDDAEATFTGLQRRLGLHPQVLSRQLKRLQDDVLVEATEDGYRATDHGHALADPVMPDAEGIEMARVVLPMGVREEEVVEALRGRWFQHLRWYGTGGGPGEQVLLWLTEPDGVLVRVRLRAGTVVVEVATAWDEATASIVAAQSLLRAVADAVQAPQV